MWRRAVSTSVVIRWLPQSRIQIVDDVAWNVSNLIHLFQRLVVLMAFLPRPAVTVHGSSVRRHLELIHSRSHATQAPRGTFVRMLKSASTFANEVSCKGIRPREVL